MVGCGSTDSARPRALRRGRATVTGSVRAIARWVALATAAMLLAGCSLNPIGPGRPTPTQSGPGVPGSGASVAPGDLGSAPPDGRPTQPIPMVNPTGVTDPPPGKGMARYRDQEITWTSCGIDQDEPLECTSVLAPLDHERPNDRAITLSLARRPAQESPRRGSLFINPGGPGASGVDYLTYFERGGLDNYDIVGWDPRGIGRSTPVRCFDGEELAAYTEMDISPDDAREDTALQQANRDFGLSCLSQSGALLEHVSTEETVRDLDLLRQLVGDRKLNYFGASYGTEIGAYYAELFPARTGRLVLDGAVSLTADEKFSQAQGFERALADFADWCVSDQSCQLGETPAEVLRAITDLWQRLDTAPLDAGNRVLTQTLAVTAVIQTLYGDEETWRNLAQALTLAIAEDNGQGLIFFSDQYNLRNENGEYGQLNAGFPAVRCLDSQDDSVAEVREESAREAEVAPVIGPFIGLDYTCALWPVPARKPLGKVSGENLPPILVIGNTGDSATPYEYAVDLADQLESGVLITYRGQGHLSYRRSVCVRSLVIDYLVSDEVPENGVKC